MLNRGKIKRSNTELFLIDEDEINFLVKYSINNQIGFLRFNKVTYEIVGYSIKSYQPDERLFKSINNTIGLEIDTIVLDYKFKKEFIEDVSFHLSYSVESLGLVATSGYIKIYDVGIEWLSTENNSHTIQYDAYLASIMDYEYAFDRKSVFFNIEDHTIKLVKDEELAYAILINLGYAPKTKFWSVSTRLNPSNFVLFDEDTEINKEKVFRSDFHKFRVDWAFYKDVNKSNKFISLPSIWNDDKAVFISKSKYNSLFLANLTFDIYEIHKNKFIEEIQNDSFIGNKERVLDLYYSEAERMVGQMNKISSYGNSISGLLKYNEYVFSENGIDNLKELIEYKSNATVKPIYSKGDIYLATGDIKQAIHFYNNILDNDNKEEKDGIDVKLKKASTKI